VAIRTQGTFPEAAPVPVEDVTRLAGCRSREDVRARRDRLVEALATNPMVPSTSLAERLLDEILDASPT
jgi:alpha-galactosidase/6-phospho-beta-glucosidase family protein